MKTNFEKVKAICDSGKIAVVEVNNEALPYISIIKTFGEIYRISQPQRTKEKALENIGYMYADLEEINDMEIVKIEPVNSPTHNIKAGDKVRILECAKDVSLQKHWCDEQIKMLNHDVYEVKNVFNESCSVQIYKKDKKDFWLFPLSCVCLDWED